MARRLQLALPPRIDARRGGGYHCAFRTFARLTSLALILGACAVRTPGPEAAPPSPELEHEAVLATAPDRPLRIVFDWTAQERDGRFRGQGVARVEPPYRARLDLFGPRQETYLTAALVEDQLRLPATAPATPVPPPPLLWSALGVFLPPAGAELVATRRVGERTTFEYVDGAARWRFVLEADRLRSAELERRGEGRQTVELRRVRPDGLAEEAAYRNWAEFRELVLNLASVEHVEPHPPDTWTPHSP